MINLLNGMDLEINFVRENKFYTQNSITHVMNKTSHYFL